MLKKNSRRGARSSGAGFRFAIVASQYNARYVNSMLGAARRTLLAAGYAGVDEIRVPGAFEIPVVAAQLASGNRVYAAIVCLGVIVRGETAHADLVGQSVTCALGEIAVRHGIPVIHEVLLLDNLQQAKARCLDPQHNRGVEAARTALAMAETMAGLRHE